MKAPNGKTNLNEPAPAAKAVRPQKVADTLGHGGGRFTPGILPAGGFQGMWVFDGTKDYKNSPTTDAPNMLKCGPRARPGRKVY